MSTEKCNGKPEAQNPIGSSAWFGFLNSRALWRARSKAGTNNRIMMARRCGTKNISSLLPFPNRHRSPTYKTAVTTNAHAAIRIDAPLRDAMTTTLMARPPSISRVNHGSLSFAILSAAIPQNSH